MGENNECAPKAGDASHTLPTEAMSPTQMHGLLAAGRAGATAARQHWSPPAVEVLQQALPQYEISAFIARGGMGAVYRGVQKALKRPVAIKVLPPEIDDEEAQFSMRFKHEAQAMARLSHPNIVGVFDAGEVVLHKGRALGPPSATGGDLRRTVDSPPYLDGGRRTEDSPPYLDNGRRTEDSPPYLEKGTTLLYFVMEFIEGTDVARLIASEGPLEPERAIGIIGPVCEALAFAHEEGIIHRDIKPSNVMIDRKGRVKVADFGLAKITHAEATLVTQSHMALGTPDFIAPEMFIPGMAVDPRADLYAVGVMLYQMLTGKLPRGRFESPSGLMPQVSKSFDAIIDKALQTDRDKRYSSAMEMKAAVEQVAATRGGLAAGPAMGEGRHRTLKARILLGFSMLALSCGGIAFFIKQPVKSSSRPQFSAANVPAPAAAHGPLPPLPPSPSLQTRSAHDEMKVPAWLQTARIKGGRIKLGGRAPHGVPLELGPHAAAEGFVGVHAAENGWLAWRTDGSALIGHFDINDHTLRIRPVEGVRQVDRGDFADVTALLHSGDILTCHSTIAPLSFDADAPGILGMVHVRGKGRLAIGRRGVLAADSAYAAAGIRKPGTEFFDELELACGANRGMVGINERGKLLGWFWQDAQPFEYRVPHAVVEAETCEGFIVCRTVSGGVFAIDYHAAWGAGTPPGSVPKYGRVPPNLPPSIRIRSGNWSGASQGRDGRWSCWSQNDGLVETVRQAGVAVDLDISARDQEWAYAIWVEPSSEAPHSPQPGK